MESTRKEEKIPAKLSNVEAFEKKLSTLEQGTVMVEFIAMAGEMGRSPQVQAIGEKYLSLLVILNSDKNADMLYQADSAPLVKLYMLFLLTNDAEMMLRGYEIAKQQGNATLESDLLQVSAVTSNAKNFIDICERVGLTADSDEYKTFLTRFNSTLRLPTPPLHVAAYCGNLMLLHDMCVSLGRENLIVLEKLSGLSLMHFAAMGGSIKVVDYLFNIQQLPLDMPSRDGISPFSYIGLSNNPEMITKFIDLGYKPTSDDKRYYNMLYCENDITILRERFNSESAPAHNMFDALLLLSSSEPTSSTQRIAAALEWELAPNISNHHDNVDLLEMTIEDFLPHDAGLRDFSNEKDEKDEKDEKQSPRFF